MIFSNLLLQVKLSLTQMSRWCDSCNLCYDWTCDYKKCTNSYQHNNEPTPSFDVGNQKVACSEDCQKSLIEETNASEYLNFEMKWTKFRCPYSQSNMICDEHYHYVDNSKKCEKDGKVIWGAGCFNCGGDLYKGYSISTQLENSEENSEESKEEKIQETITVFVCSRDECGKYISFMYGLPDISTENSSGNSNWTYLHKYQEYDGPIFCNCESRLDYR